MCVTVSILPLYVYVVTASFLTAMEVCSNILSQKKTKNATCVLFSDLMQRRYASTGSRGGEGEVGVGRERGEGGGREEGEGGGRGGKGEGGRKGKWDGGGGEGEGEERELVGVGGVRKVEGEGGRSHLQMLSSVPRAVLCCPVEYVPLWGLCT